jgi:hypothetical protein
MHVQKLVITEAEAVKLLQRYQTHKNYEKPNAFDMEVTRIAKLIAKGKMIIKAQGSIVGAGLNDNKLPKLAIARADAPWCRLNVVYPQTAVMLSGIEWSNGKTARDKIFKFEANAFPGIVAGKNQHRAIMPHIPPDIRPKRGIENYHVLWEAVWEKVPPVDPILLRRVGKSDFFMVLAQWELTEVEREVMRGRIGVQ